MFIIKEGMTCFYVCEIFLGADAILLGAETMRGLYPVESISIVGKICGEVLISSINVISSFFFKLYF